jgi:hypothetical protein
MPRRISSSRLYKATVDEYVRSAEYHRDLDRQLAERVRARDPEPCPTCTYAPCACASTDEATDLILEAAHFGDDLDLPGWD